MPKDLKIGILFGLALAAAAAVWLSTRPCLKVKSTLLSSKRRYRNQAAPGEEPRFTTNRPAAPAAEKALRQPSSQDRTLDYTKYQQTDKIKTQKFHIVRKGETLSRISYKYYHTARNWKKIRDANPGAIINQDKIKPGTKLIIPD